MGLLLALLIFIIIAASISISKRRQIRRSEQVYIGMPEREMLEFMEKGYTRSLLKNGRTKYEMRKSYSLI